jgi:hypothetical protein
LAFSPAPPQAANTAARIRFKELTDNEESSQYRERVPRAAIVPRAESDPFPEDPGQYLV